MNYYFDVKLNFLSNYYQVFEWSDLDNLMNVKKIPIFKVDFSDFVNIYSKKIKVSEEFLLSIKNKTLIENGLIESAAIFTDSKSSVALIFSAIGESILYSTLQYNDEINIEEIAFKIKKEKVEYEIVNDLKPDITLRKDRNKVKFINDEINVLIKNNELYKLEYIYLEIYNKREKCLEKIKKDLTSESFLFTDKLYKLLSVSKNNV